MAFTFPLSKLSFGTIQDTKATAAVHKDTELKQYAALDLQKDLIQVDFPDDQYYKIETNKKQIILHHTVSGQGVNGDINFWRSTADRIATHVIVDFKGAIYQCYSTKYWGHHLGCKSDFLKSKGFADYATRNKILNEQSIGIEIDAWGGLIKSKGLWYPAKTDETTGKLVANIKAGQVINVQEYPNGYRGFYGFEKYTDAQIESVRKLLVFWCNKFNIPKTYNEDMWDVSMNALSGNSGIYSHISYRSDKSDCHPQTELIAMLKSL
jgi:N-acetyl-anhydromuramyl-L-alanine amidase AmpD